MAINIKRTYKHLKFKIKKNMLIKLRKVNKDLKVYEIKILEYTKMEQKYIDELNNKQRIIRELELENKDLKKALENKNESSIL